MDVDLDSVTPNNLYLGETPIRAYSSIPLHLQENHPFPNINTVLRRLQGYRTLDYPYTWLLYDQRAVIVNFDDIYEYYAGQQPPSSSTTTGQQPPLISFVTDDGDEDSSTRQAINESFEQAASHVPCSGLTEELISKNLRVTKYCEEEEEGEICVVCQVEFESNERVAMLQCKHLYHQECIKEWLVRRNVCPLCKAQALSV